MGGRLDLQTCTFLSNPGSLPPSYFPTDILNASLKKKLFCFVTVQSTYWTEFASLWTTKNETRLWYRSMLTSRIYNAFYQLYAVYVRHRKLDELRINYGQVPQRQITHYKEQWSSSTWGSLKLLITKRAMVKLS